MNLIRKVVRWILFCLWIFYPVVISGRGQVKDEKSHGIILRVHMRNQLIVAPGRLVVRAEMNQPSQVNRARNKPGKPDLQWEIAQAGKKMTVAWHAGNTVRPLFIQAVNCSGGKSTGRIQLSARARDLVILMSPHGGGCDCQYQFAVNPLSRLAVERPTVMVTITDIH